MELATRIGGIAGVFAVCPPMRLQDLSSKFVPAVDAWSRLMKKIQINGDILWKDIPDIKFDKPDEKLIKNGFIKVIRITKLKGKSDRKIVKFDDFYLELKGEN